MDNRTTLLTGRNLSKQFKGLLAVSGVDIQIEQGEGNPTLKSLNAVFRPFGLQMGVVKVRRKRDD
mgnify:CR=1 FL=1